MVEDLSKVSVKARKYERGPGQGWLLKGEVRSIRLGFVVVSSGCGIPEL